MDIANLTYGSYLTPEVVSAFLGVPRTERTYSLRCAELCATIAGLMKVRDGICYDVVIRKDGIKILEPQESVPENQRRYRKVIRLLNKASRILSDIDVAKLEIEQQKTCETTLLRIGSLLNVYKKDKPKDLEQLRKEFGPTHRRVVPAN